MYRVHRDASSRADLTPYDNKLKKEDQITEDECIILRTHRVAMNLLAKKTMGDPNRFTDKTTMEIYNEMIAKTKQQATQKYLRERTEHDKTKTELAILKSKLSNSEQKRKNIGNIIKIRAKQVSRIAGYTLYIILCLLFIAGLLVQISTDFLLDYMPIRIILIVINGLFAISDFASGFNFKGLRSKTINWLENVIENILNKFLRMLKEE